MYRNRIFGVFVVLRSIDFTFDDEKKTYPQHTASAQRLPEGVSRPSFPPNRSSFPKLKSISQKMGGIAVPSQKVKIIQNREIFALNQKRGIPTKNSF